MKYFSLSTVAEAYNRNRSCTKNKFWGLLAILSNIDSVAKAGVGYDFSTKQVSQLLEDLFHLDDDKKQYLLDTTWNIMLSNKWVQEVSSQMLSRTPNIYDIIVWYFRHRAFEDNISRDDLISLFLAATHIQADDAKTIFAFSKTDLDYNESLYKESDLLSVLKIKGSNVNAEGNSIQSNPGELARAPFVQTLYANQTSLQCLIITPFKLSDYYSDEDFIRTSVHKKLHDSGLIPNLSNACIETVKTLSNLLLEKHNVVLTGAPGTGKTWLTRAIVNAMNAVTGFVQFHPSYDYTDFVEGLRPALSEDSGGSSEGVSFARQDGIFKKFCKDALKSLSDPETKDVPYVFIIDEINRGELSKIFGELFFAIDPGYRGTAGRISTQYQTLITDPNDVFKEGFYVPSNVYILGTMNDIDRSVESMDFAIRRRFAWREITAEQSAENMNLGDKLKVKMKKVNDAILDCELTPAYHIGAAYFKDFTGSDYETLWVNHIKGLVEEYFRGNPDGPDYVEKIHKALVED